MPSNLIAHTDPLALTALGFLGAILIATVLLFGWLMTRSSKPKKND